MNLIQNIIQHTALKNTSIIFLLIMGACNNKKAPETQTDETTPTEINLTAAQFKNAGITIGKVEQKQVSSTLKVNGKIDVPPQNMVSISVPMGGYLKATNLLPGMHVSKGEIIATIEDQQYIQLQQDLLIAKALFS